MGCSNRAPDARAEHRYRGQSLVFRRGLQCFIGNFVEDIFLDLGGLAAKVVLWFIEIAPVP